MKPRSLSLPLLIALAGAALCAEVPESRQRPAPRTFDAEPPGVPERLTFAAMRQPSPGSWTIRRDGANGVLVHAADPAATGYALAVSTAPPIYEVVAAARLRLAGGARAGGVVWQYHDQLNYYAAVLDLARQQLSLFRIVAGNRTRLEFEDDLELDVSAWHTMKVVHDAREIAVSIGGIKVFEERARSTRIVAPGRTGLLATGDSEVWFDEVRAEPRQGRR